MKEEHSLQNSLEVLIFYAMKVPEEKNRQDVQGRAGSPTRCRRSKFFVRARVVTVGEVSKNSRLAILEMDEEVASL